MELIQELKQKTSPERKKANEYFFKTKKGQYAEGDKFIGVSMPDIRAVVKNFKNLSLEEIKHYLNSEIHEVRMAALLILVNKYHSSQHHRKNISDFYLANTKYINNWDLVDVTAPKLLGHYLLDKEKDILYKLANSQDLWEKRIAIVSTLYFISKNQFQDTIKISKILLSDKHDLIHKAVGWMLREVGKRDIQVLEDFLKTHYNEIPRTTLRYAIERFPEQKRQKYLKNKI